MFDEYYGVEQLQTCRWLNEPELWRTLGKIPLKMCSRSYLYQWQTVSEWCHSKTTIFVCFTRLSQSTAESSGFKPVVASTNRIYCVSWVKFHSKCVFEPICINARPHKSAVTKFQRFPFALQDFRRVLPSRATSNLSLPQRIEFIAYPGWNSTPNVCSNLSVPMRDRIKVMSQKNNDFRLLHKTFAEYYPVGRLQTCSTLNESKLLRTVGGVPLQLSGRISLNRCQTPSVLF